MLRTKLVIAFLALLAPSVIMGSLLYWGPRQIEQRLDRSFLAHHEVQLYLTLALQTYRDLQRLSYEAMLGDPVGEEEILAARRRVDGQLAELRRITLEEVAFVGVSEPEERAELARIARFEQLADAWIAALTAPGAADHEALRRRIGLLDQRLGALIDEVMVDETGEATLADQQTRTLTERLTMAALMVVLLAVICAVVTALWARRRIQAPIEALREGTRRIARDGLDHRVQVAGRDELAALAMSFNWMAAELQGRRAELDRSRAELERQVRQRTRELRASNQALRRMDAARRRMFADISHALRTPLTVIRGEAEVTLRARDGPGRNVRAALERIVETTSQVNKLVEDLLTVARSDTPAAPAETRTIRVADLVREVGEDARALASDKGIVVSCALPDAPIDTRGDPDRLRQAMLILADNACRYTRAGGRIAIALAAQERDAVLTVADSGVGIPPEELDLVAGRFYRGSNAGALAPSGAGLGLHIATSIIEAHGGAIEVESEQGRGTRVTVRLPLCQESDQESGQESGQEQLDERAAG